MITDRDFIVLSDDWNGLPTSAIHLFRRLATRNRIFWFNTIGRFPRLTRGDAGKVLRTLGLWFCKTRNKPSQESVPKAGVHVISPVMVPWFKTWGRRFNCRSQLRAYRRLCDQYEITAPIVLTTFPHAVDFVKVVPAAAKIYYCVDDFLDYPGVNHADWARMEADLLAAVDGLIVTSRHLAKKRSNGCPVLHLPHGVDFDHFSQGAVRAKPVPPLEMLPRPIIGFFGLISPWFDRELVTHLSEVFPGVSFLLIGQADVDLGPLAGRPNVHRIGFVPYAELPAYARYFDVGLIPYRRQKFTRSINPLKLLEYFALGLPVLATRLPELEAMPGSLYLARTREEFVESLRILLAGRATERVEEARECARQNTWEVGVEQFSVFIEQVVREEQACAR
jgi:glycosyltransferase involved in cell wall biosynthesis